MDKEHRRLTVGNDHADKYAKAVAELNTRNVGRSVALQEDIDKVKWTFGYIADRHVALHAGNTLKSRLQG